MTENEEPTGSRKEPQENERRISVSSARNMLGMIGKNYDDEDILGILDVLYGIAEEAFEIYAQSPDEAEQDD